MRQQVLIRISLVPQRELYFGCVGQRRIFLKIDWRILFSRCFTKACRGVTTSVAPMLLPTLKFARRSFQRAGRRVWSVAGRRCTGFFRSSTSSSDPFF